MKLTKFLSIVFSLLTFCALQAKAESLATDLVKGDELYKERKDLEKAYLALSLFEKRLDTASDDVEALWRASMANYYIGHLLDKEKKRINHYKNGVARGKNCVNYSQGKRVECYFWLATNTALLKQEWGILSMAFGLGDIISLFEKAMALDPLYAGSGAHRMLALLHFKAPGFLGGDVKKAYKYITQATKNSPNEPLNVSYHMKFLFKDKKIEEARKIGEDFLKVAKPENFAFFESKSAHENIIYFLNNKRFLDED